jgi:hypothetical protein
MTSKQQLKSSFLQYIDIRPTNNYAIVEDATNFVASALNNMRLRATPRYI